MATGATLEHDLARAVPPDMAAAALGLCHAFAAGPGFRAAPAALPLRWLLTEGQGRPAATDTGSGIAAAVAPMAADGPEGPAGALFTLRPACDDPEATFMAAPPAATVAGCLLRGGATLLALAAGGAAALHVFDPACGRFARRGAALRIPDDAPVLAAELGGYRHWERPVQRFADECFAGAAGPQGRDHAMRWSGMLAAEAIAVLTRGGICLCPAGAGPAPSLIHVGQPLALLAEAAGGRATDGRTRLLDRPPASLGETRPLAFGSAAQVARLSACHDLPDADASPLFGRRGLFRI